MTEDRLALLEARNADLEKRLENMEIVSANLIERLDAIEKAVIKVSEALSSLFELLKQLGGLGRTDSGKKDSQKE
jgi:uncharacterized coiled-coil protein SlyX